MTSKLKRDQIPLLKANNWRKSFKEEKELTLNLKIPQIVLQKETYKILAGDNENRVRIYLGLEPIKDKDTLQLCAYAISAFLLGSGDVYVDYETPVYKLEKQNVNCSSKTAEVIESIRRFRGWRDGNIDTENEASAVRQYIYPSAYLLTKFELHEIFNVQDKNEAQIEFGISKTMNVMISPGSEEGGSDVFDYAQPCPPTCDDRSIYNS